MKNMTAKQKRSLLAGVLLMFCYGLTNNTVGFFITPVTEALGCSRASFNLYYTVMSIVSLCVSPFFGQLLEKVAIRKLLLIGAVWGGIGFIGFSFCGAMPMFYVVAAFIGLVQSGVTNVSAAVIVNRTFPDGGGSAMGLVAAGTGICSVIMSLILPGFIQNTSWQTGYIMNAVVWFALLMIAAILVGNEKPSAKTEKDENSSDHLSGATFAQAIHSPAIYFFLLLTVLYTITSIFVQHLPAFYQEQGMSVTMAGTIMSIFSIFLIICKISLGMLCDRLGTVKTTVVAYLCYALGLWIMLFGGVPMLCIGSAFAAFGLASSTVLTPMMTREIFGVKAYASIWGVISMAVALGAALGSPAWGLVYDILGAYHYAVLIVPVLVIILGLLLAFLMTRKHPWDEVVKPQTN